MPLENSSPKFVFVYGTLKKGKRNHFVISNLEFVSNGETNDKAFYLQDNGSFPYLLRTKSKKLAKRIKGEVYAVNTKDLEALDRFEGVPHLYNREQINVRLANGAVVVCNVYIPNYDPNERILETDNY